MQPPMKIRVACTDSVVPCWVGDCFATGQIIVIHAAAGDLRRVLARFMSLAGEYGMGRLVGSVPTAIRPAAAWYLAATGVRRNNPWDLRLAG